MRDIDQPRRWSGNPSISPDIGRKTRNDRSFFLVGWRRLDEVENDRQELASLESMDRPHPHILVPSPLGHGGANFPRPGRIRRDNANTWMVGTHCLRHLIQ